MYVNYARPEDFDRLRSLGLALEGAIALARVGGGVSFAEKVRLAQSAGMVGVLVYPDPADVPQDPRRLGLSSDAAISEHVRPGEIALEETLYITHHYWEESPFVFVLFVIFLVS